MPFAKNRDAAKKKACILYDQITKLLTKNSNYKTPLLGS